MVKVTAFAKLIVPPDKTIVPDAVPTVIFPEFTVPATLMVPEASPALLVPKLIESVVAVLTLFPFTVVMPVLLVLQPEVSVPMVGAVQVPVAVPKPDAESLPSQKYCAEAEENAISEQQARSRKRRSEVFGFMGWISFSYFRENKLG